MIDERKFNQYGFPREEADILGITIHESEPDGTTAQEIFDYLNTESKENIAYHYICDDVQILQILPDNWGVYSVSSNKDWSSMHTISIEIVGSISNSKYQEAQDNAVGLIRTLQETYGISDDMIFLHNDFDSRAFCPKTILDRYGSAKRFAIEEL